MLFQRMPISYQYNLINFIVFTRIVKFIFWIQLTFAQQPKVVARGARLMVSSGGCEQPPNARFALRSHRALCAQPRRQRQKLRRLAAELLAEFRGPARNARCERTQKGGLFPYFAGPALDFFSKRGAN